MDGTHPEDEDLPQALVEALNLGLASGDWHGVLDLFVDHGTLVVDLGSRTSFEGPEGIRDALEGIREEFPGAQYASSPLAEGDEEALVADLLAASGPDAPAGRVHLDLTHDRQVRQALLELDDAPHDPGPAD